MTKMQLLTNSRMSCAKTCLRRHYFAYELGIRKEQESTPLRVGSAIHLGLEMRASGADVDVAILEATKGYILTPHYMEPEEWQVEREIVARLISGYYWRYEQDNFEIVANELSFQIPIFNPQTGRRSPLFCAAGKIDKIIKLSDGRLAVMEHKTTADDLSTGSDYWPRLRLDQQISLYFLAARELGYDVQTILYDVIRKPGIRPKLIKNVRETPEQFGDRLTVDIGERPDFYFARREIPRLQADLDEFQAELWQQQKMIRESQLTGRWFRNTNACLFPYKCEFTDICFMGLDPTNGVPLGYAKLRNLHPELGDMNHVNGNQTTSATTANETGAVASTNKRKGERETISA